MRVKMEKRRKRLRKECKSFLYILSYILLSTLLLQICILRHLNKFEPIIILNHKYEEISNSDEVSKHFFIIDQASVLKLKKNKFNSENDSIEPISRHARKIYEAVQENRKIALNFVEEYRFNNTQRVVTKNLPTVDNQTDSDVSLEDPFEMMNKKMDLMLTVSNPERLRGVKVSHSLPRLNEDIAKNIPNFKRYFH